MERSEKEIRMSFFFLKWKSLPLPHSCFYQLPGRKLTPAVSTTGVGLHPEWTTDRRAQIRNSNRHKKNLNINPVNSIPHQKLILRFHRGKIGLYIFHAAYSTSKSIHCLVSNLSYIKQLHSIHVVFAFLSLLSVHAIQGKNRSIIIFDTW